ncbi:hypothetical protein V8D89_008537 [Ganoderma adspersum]
MATALRILLCTLLLSPTGAVARSAGSNVGVADAARAIQRDQVDHLHEFSEPVQPPEPDAAASKRTSLITFSDPRAQAFQVDGTKIPEVTWDAGPSWSGLMPISGDANETRKLFFWFWPTTDAANVNDLVFWTNGGPGCSALEGFLQENGPISWSWGQAEPTPNRWTWTNLANMLWVEQPIGTGFSQGVPTIADDDALAAQVAGFLEQFLDIFSELKGSNFWVTGESYAGYFVPYIANYLYENPNPDLNLKGIWMADPSLSWGLIQEAIPALRFVQANRNVFPLNSTFMAQLQNISDSCGYTDYFDKYVMYPPTGPLPLPAGAVIDQATLNVNVRPECRIRELIQNAAQVINPSFDAYRVTDTWPTVWSVLGEPRSTQKFIYFNRTDVQTAINAPQMHWKTCNHAVYADPKTGALSENDPSVPSALSVLPNVIEKSERVAIVHGLADFMLLPEGTRILIQNMTWNGLQGFQTPIEEESFLVDDMGVFGHMHTERGLTYVEMFYSGHMAPQFVPWATYQTLAFVLGKRDSPSA